MKDCGSAPNARRRVAGTVPSTRGAEGRKLTKDQVHEPAFRFFVSSATKRLTYGGAPVIHFNDQHYGKSDIVPSEWLKKDIQFLEEAGKIGFFHYGPRYLLVGEVEPLKAGLAAVVGSNRIAV